MNNIQKKLQGRNNINSNREFRKIKSSKFLYEINSNGTIVRNVKSKKHLKIVLDFHHSMQGYYYVWYQSKRHSIASLVAECWLGDKPKNYEVDHIDRNPHNNDYYNLRYVTHSQQMKNRDYTNISQRGKQNLLNATIVRRQPIKLINISTQVVYSFVSKLHAAKFLASQLNSTIESMRQRLKKKRSHIKGFDIIYLNAETANNHSTE